MWIAGPEDFDEHPAPDGMRFWQLRDRPESALFPDPVPVDVLLAHHDLTGIDLAHLTTVVSEIDRYLTAAFDFVRGRMAEDPAFFGVGKPLSDIPLTDPSVVVNDDGWLIHFLAGLPVCDPYGLAVHFDGDRAVEVEGLSQYEQLD